MLEIRIRHKADDRIERQGRFHMADAVRVEGQYSLYPQDQIPRRNQHDIR